MQMASSRVYCTTIFQTSSLKLYVCKYIRVFSQAASSDGASPQSKDFEMSAKGGEFVTPTRGFNESFRKVARAARREQLLTLLITLVEKR